MRADDAPAALSSALLDCIQSGLMALDGERRLLVINEAARRLLGVAQPCSGAPADVAVRECSKLDRPQQDRLLLLATGELADAIEITTQGGQAFSVSRQVAPDGTLLLSFSPAAAPLNLDNLTGIADRSSFHRRLEELCAVPNARVGVVMIDLDRFKSINDTLGHPAGDALLKLVAQRLRSTFRNADIVSRLGGDEFAVAMSDASQAESVAQRLVSVLSRPYLVDRNAAVIGASAGIAYGPQHGTDPASLIRAADLALYQAKADGRGTVRVFNDAMDQRARSRHALADDLRRAIPLQQLELHFQPQLDLDTRTLTGFEALVRWRHPERGLISPDQFIPLAEETGTILQLGEWVLREACRVAMTWPGQLRVAVNVSPKQLLDRDRLPRLVEATLLATGLAPRRLELEITESTLVREAETLDILTMISGLGVRISMDDFGTGYSSLSQLRRFPFDKIKIDRSFVRDLGESSEAAAVVRAIAALGKSLGMTTTAEGVETLDQEAMCRNDGCTEMQGYLISKPIPESEVADLIRSLT